MPETGLPAVFVHLLPGLIPSGSLKGGVAVVLDVLRATTVMVQALASGASAVIPCGEIEEARDIAAGLPAGKAILAGERQGLPIDGFDFGNSPGSFTPEVCRGKSLVMTTTNGTKAILASLDADRVIVGAFPNFAATMLTLHHATERHIHIVCAGTDGRISFEDALLAGAFAQHLKDLGSPLENDEAEIAAGAWSKIHNSLWFKSGDPDVENNPLVRYLSRGRGGRRVTEIGLAADIAAAGRLNDPRQQLTAELKRDPLRIVAVSKAVEPSRR
ncbi:2-phosphosulfolactate phosphatase [Singulisphaera sp. PoT]|uniref:2-phosphosulfolactate phosphatase n=1 Tax=Singulisphaera sp. PoT TaxID=3411797 RepID=UPI003BF52D52